MGRRRSRVRLPDRLDGTGLDICPSGSHNSTDDQLLGVLDSPRSIVVSPTCPLSGGFRGPAPVSRSVARLRLRLRRSRSRSRLDGAVRYDTGRYWTILDRVLSYSCMSCPYYNILLYVLSSGCTLAAALAGCTGPYSTVPYHGRS
jgi:hypothetical protein